MFYSQFILAKKGPLGTIWIAAHLERKLRKNQVADTDIGVSVDSILSPDVPIALRLSSHLLVGVVRIYSRKVNYLFDDCSEALLKIKQAFRSTAVDLPPEESTAPYHSITLPETFDLDDFELPDNDFQGNYVDHHISSRDQITLQDTMEGVVYSTSQFGLDERFGDGDTSGLDLDEELFLSKVTAGHDDFDLNSRTDPQSSVQHLTSHDHEGNDEMIDKSKFMITSTNKHIEENDGTINHSYHIEYDQAPHTPGLLEEPNLSNILETSACDEHLETENHNLTEFAARENLENASSDHVGAIAVENVSSVNTCPDPSIPDGVEDVQNGIICNHKPHISFADKTSEDCRELQEVRPGENNIGTPNLSNTCEPVSEGILMNNGTSHKAELSDNVENAGDIVQSCLHLDALKSNAESNGPSEHEKSETQEKIEKSRDTSEPGISVHEYVVCTEEANQIESSVAPNIPFDIAGPSLVALEWGEDPLCVQGKEFCEDDGSKQVTEGNHVGLLVPCDRLNERAENVNALDSQSEPINSSICFDIPAPEKLMSVPEVDALKNMSMGATPAHTYAQNDGSNDTNVTVTGKKRSFTESSLTMQSMNSVDSSAIVRHETTSKSVPDDDDLLSSILVGRKSFALKVKETPQQGLPYLKRHKAAPRASASKRKVLMDDMMVLHGDMIRQQLTNTEDIRRLRKKAPCTRPEILMIQKQFLEDDMFSETIFTGASLELASMHNETYDLSEAKISLDDVTINDASELGINPSTVSQKDKAVAFIEAAHDMDLYDEFDSRVAEIAGSSNIMGVRITDKAQPAQAPAPMENQQGDGNVVSLDPTIDIAEARELQEFHSETIEMNVDAANLNEISVVNSSSTVDVSVNDAGNRTAGVIHFAADITNEIDASLQVKPPVETTNQELGVHSVEIDANADADKKDLDIDVPVVHNAQKTEEIPLNEMETCPSETDIQKNGVAHTESIPTSLLSLDTGECSTHILSDEHVMDERRHNDHTQLEEDIFLYAEAEYNPENLERGLCDVENVINCTDSVMVDVDLRNSTYGNTTEADIDQVNYNNLEFSTAGNDTEFLNHDDDEEAEADDDDVPNAEVLLVDNSGWSSRTRAVAKYLQTLFDKETERERNVLPIDNLLAGKSRKEASRMFFETLVLKTKDYIHVEQLSPYNNINILPRAELNKVDF
ncbi:Sister chromatid cohesion 1 protein 4 [Heracleum sosnowskyi]|uniref:Sister chromatid cohesion 1 protein 4 n=1 Tax=Heracleum sosnowskyi TaxID=360622 RepID=A0AAD8MI12_9APIA|nr:Sister chromatid cohesion 1 protein 4 [Heracleum sosnowskyi]